MALPNSLKNFNIFNDAQSYMGVAEEIKLPKLSRKLEDFRGGGMDGPVGIDLGQEKLEMEVNCGGFVDQVFKQYGITKAAGTMLRFAGAYQRDDTGDVKAVEIVTRGRVQEIDPGTAKLGDKTGFNFKLSLTYFKLMIDNEEVLEIDLLAFIFKVDGTDQFEAQRKAIGLA